MGHKPDDLKNTTYELFIGALSVLSIINLVLYFLWPSQNVSSVILIMNGFLSVIFMTDFLYRLFTAESKSAYFFHQMGWVDLLASLPAPQFKIVRVFRIVRVYRLMIIYGGKPIIENFISNRGGSALLILIFLMLLILEFGGLAILAVESKSPNANIKDAGDALWYVYVTITTVGYGEQYPVTSAGRIFGVVIMTFGVALFGTITGFLAHSFIKPDDDGAIGKETPSADPAGLAMQMGEIKQMLLAYEKTYNDLQARLEGIEASLEKLNK